MDDKQPEEYEDISFDNKTDDNIEAEELSGQSSEVSSDTNELQSIAIQLSKDFSDFFNFDINQEKKETEDAIEDLLTHLEEFCGLIEMIRNDNNICLEEVLKNISDKSRIMNEIYAKIDKLEQFVQIVKQCVDNMDRDLTKAEQLFGDNNNNRVKNFFTSFMTNTSKQTIVKRIDDKYEPKEIFKTTDYIIDLNSSDLSLNYQNSDQSHENCSSNS